MFVLVQGDTIPVQRPRIANERLFFRHANLDQGKESVQCPLSSVAMLWLDSPAAIDEVESWRAAAAEASAASAIGSSWSMATPWRVIWVGLDEAKATLGKWQEGAARSNVKQIGGAPVQQRPR